MVATGYCLYSVTMTMVLVLTLGSRVLGSTLEAIYAGSGQADAFANPPEYEDTGHGLYKSFPRSRLARRIFVLIAGNQFTICIKSSDLYIVKRVSNA